MLSSVVKAGGGMVSIENASVGFFTGSVSGALTPFTNTVGSGNGDANDGLFSIAASAQALSLSNPRRIFATASTGGGNSGILLPPHLAADAPSINDSTHALWRWQWRATSPIATIFKLTASADVKLTVSMDADVTGQWATSSAFIYTAENTDGTQKVIRTLPVTATIPKGSAYATVHLAKGESFYLSYESSGGTMTATFMPIITLSAKDYNALERPDYSAQPDTTPSDSAQTLTYSDMLSAVVGANGADASSDYLAYGFSYGDFFGGGELRAFPKVFGTGENDPGDILAEPDTVAGAGDAMNALWRWQWRMTDPYDTVMKITAKEDLRLSVSMGSAQTSQWAFSSAFVYVTEDTEGKRTEIKRIAVTETIPAESASAAVSLAKGESLYIVYTSTVASTQTASFTPVFTADPEGFNAEADPDSGTEPQPGENPSEDESLFYSDMLSAAVKAKGGAVSASLYEYQFLYGGFKNNTLKAFVKAFGTGENDPGDILAAPDSVASADAAAHALWRWQWRTSGANVTALKFTAKENMRVDINMGNAQTNQWAFQSAFEYVIENSEGRRTTVKTIQVKETITPEMVAGTVHLKKGETLYVVYTNNKGGAADIVTASFIPTLKLSPAGYDSGLGSGSSSSPKTADNAFILFAVAVFLGSAAMLIFVIRRQSRLNKKGGIVK
jgi:hypothetical protein